MKVHLIKEKTIRQYVSQHAQGKPSFDGWLLKLFEADWNIPEDIQATFGSADLLGRGSSRVVFDIGGNNFRMIGKYAFGENTVHLFVCWIGTHAEYSKLCKNNDQYTINVY